MVFVIVDAVLHTTSPLILCCFLLGYLLHTYTRCSIPNVRTRLRQINYLIFIKLKIRHYVSSFSGMLQNYFKIAWRTLLKNKGYSVLNILGLAIGMAVTLLIGLWVYDEYSYDTWLPASQQVYQVRRNFSNNGDTLNFTTVSLKLAETLRDRIPEIEYVAESEYVYPHGLKAGDKKFFLSGTIVGVDFLKMFQFPMLQGSAETVFKDPYSIVLTETTARALFGTTEAIGQTVRFENKNDLKVL